MSRIIVLSLGLMLSLSAFAQDLSVQGFNNRFTLVRDASGKITSIKLKKVVNRFTIKPFLDQLKHDLLLEQLGNKGDMDKEMEIDQLLLDMGYEPYAKSAGSEEAQKIKEALLNVRHINVNQVFSQVNQTEFWKEFETKLNEAFLFIDPSVMANLDDSRFFYKRNVTYKVVKWALDQAQKRFSNVPALNIASFVIVRVHEMMLEQRHFHHNMLLHYFETVNEKKLGMTKEEVDRTVSSIYEYRIDAVNFMESNRAANDWLNFGMNSFYGMVRNGNNRIKSWEAPTAAWGFQGIKKLNFAFASAVKNNARHIYHVHMNTHRFSKNPALAFDYSQPNRVKRNRALLNIAGVALGFVQMPGWLKGNINSFMESFYVNQVRMEGALVGYFESTGDTTMIKNIYGQRANFYIYQ